jgi:hypothetical protein
MRGSYTALLLLIAATAQPLLASAASNGYSGRESLIGLPAAGPDGSVSGVAPFVAEQGSRLSGERVFAGYRFESGLGLEGAQVQTPARGLIATTDNFGLAATLTVPLAERWSAIGKAGVSISEAAASAMLAGQAGVPPHDRVIALGVAWQAADRVQVTATSQRLAGRADASLGSVPGQSFALGARLQF